MVIASWLDLWTDGLPPGEKCKLISDIPIFPIFKCWSKMVIICFAKPAHWETLGNMTKSWKVQLVYSQIAWMLVSSMSTWICSFVYFCKPFLYSYCCTPCIPSHLRVKWFPVLVDIKILLNRRVPIQYEQKQQQGWAFQGFVRIMK